MTNELLEDVVSEAIGDYEAETNSSPSDYELSEDLKKLGYDFDSTAIYIPYTFKFEDNRKDERDIYLKVSRVIQSKVKLTYSWTSKEDGEYRVLNFFSRDKLLAEENIDESGKASINKKLSYCGRISRLNAEQGSYKEFFEDLLINIVNSPCLRIFKEVDYEFQVQDETETSEDDIAEDETSAINCFGDYSEDIQKEAEKLLKSGQLFLELQRSISLTHQGHNMTRDSLILQESSVFITDGVHGLLDGDSGEGKSDLAFAIGYNFPNKYVKILRNVSPKNIYYDCESYNDDFNILIFDDLPLNEDMVNILKELADNTKKVKELKTVINGKAVKFRLEGKFIVILTYAKNIEDGELANRLYNVGVNIIDKSNGKSLVKHKIRDNSVIGGNFNPIIERKRSIIQASIHNLIEKDMNVFNPFLDIFNPTDYNNRDVNHFINMVKARSFFDYYQRKQIKVNDELTITIGSFEDFEFVDKIWSNDAEAQKFKLSEKQKQILKQLPSKTQDEAFEYVETITRKYKETQSKKAKAKLLDDVPTKKMLGKKLGINQNTLTNLLDKSKENSTTKSLIELGLVDKIQLEETTYKPNFYYKIKNEGKGLFSSEKSIEAIEIQFQESFQDSLVKQTIIINLLFYCNILLNEIGFQYMKKYCDDYEKQINLRDYNSYYDMINTFFDGLDYEKMCVKLETSSLDELNLMIDFKEKIKRDFYDKYASEGVVNEGNSFQDHSIKADNTANDKQSEKSLLNSESNRDNSIKKGNRDFLENIGVDVSIAYGIHDLLAEGGKTIDEIRTSLCEGLNPSDVDSHSLALKVEMNVKRLLDNELLEIVSYSNKAMTYAVNDKFSELLGLGDGHD